MFGLHRFKLHRHLVDGTVKCVWFRQVFGLLRVRFRQVSLYLIVQSFDYEVMNVIPETCLSQYITRYISTFLLLNYYKMSVS